MTEHIPHPATELARFFHYRDTLVRMTWTLRLKCCINDNPELRTFQSILSESEIMYTCELNNAYSRANSIQKEQRCE